MVDVATKPNKNNGGDILKMKLLMGRTPGILKSKFLSVLGSSNEILNGISSKLEALSLSSSSETQTTADQEDIQGYKKQRLKKSLAHEIVEKTSQEVDDDESLDDYIIDFESRRVKERRAHEEVLSGRYRHPNFVVTTRMTPDDYDLLDLNQPTSASLSSTDVSNSNCSNSIDSRSPNCDVNDETCAIKTIGIADDNADITKIQQSQLYQNTPAIDILPPSDDIDNIASEKQKKDIITSSISTSENDLGIPSVSYESSDLKIWIRSESVNSVPSWASSISLDSQSEEAVLEFLRRFLTILFENSTSISLELKSEFGQIARTEAGRLWFSRLVNAQRVKSKRVDETTFYSLVQYFAIVLFECHESEDFSPAKSLMNMCFTFFHEIDVPGCEPYREYLYIYLRDQPIWHSLRFWNAAFFDALQCERAHRPVPQTSKWRNSTTIRRSSSYDHSSLPNSDNDQSISSTQTEVDGQPDLINAESNADHLKEFKEDQKFQQNITFGQLGTFTCNMHAFGLTKDLCLEFLRKQCIIANLNIEQEKMLRDNINRMYRETDKWRD